MLPSLLGRHIVPAVTLLVTLSFVSIAALLVHVARELDAHTAEQTFQWAGKAIDRRFEISGKEIKDYAAWGEAYQHLHLKTDIGWAFDRQNLGPPLYKDLSYDDVFVVGPAGMVTYGVLNGRLAGPDMVDAIRGGLDGLVRRAREVEPGETKPVTALLEAGGVPLIAAAAAISTGGDPTIALTPGPPSVLVFADALTPDRLEQIGQETFVQGLRLAIPDATAQASSSTLVKTTEDASLPITFRWTPDRPGDLLLTRIMPWLCMGGCSFAFLAIIILRRMMGAARIIQPKARALTDAHRQAEHAAHHDSVTGLPNRLKLRRYLDAALNRAGGIDTVTLVYIDLDRFKPVNDAFGHQAGDEVLQRTARRLQAAGRDNGLIARVGGDEFVLAWRGAMEPGEIAQRCFGLLDLVSRPIEVNGHTVAVGLSIGVAMVPADARTADDLMKCADIAMYRAKSQGGNAYRMFAEAPTRHESLGSSAAGLDSGEPERSRHRSAPAGAAP